MTVITNTEIYQFGTLTYSNNTHLVDGRYDISIFEKGPDYLPPTIAALSGDGDDNISIFTFRDFIETFSLGAGNDSFYLETVSSQGRSGVLHGGAGDDFINGYMLSAVHGDAGNDILSSSGDVFGGEGDDDVYSETNAYGGAGSDTVASFSGFAKGEDGDDIVSSAFGEASGGNGNDTVFSGTVAKGGAGNDSVSGSSAYGDDGDDIVIGGSFASGGAGNDIISARGAAIMIGGSGDDVFRFAKGELGFNYASRDKITDFELGRDKIDLIAFEGSGISLSHTSGHNLVKIDVNNDFKTDFLIQVNVVGGGVLTMGDLLIV